MTRQLAVRQQSTLGLNMLLFARLQPLKRQLYAYPAIDFTIDSCRDNLRSIEITEWFNSVTENCQARFCRRAAVVRWSLSLTLIGVGTECVS